VSQNKWTVCHDVSLKLHTGSGGVSTRTVSWNLLVFIVDLFYVVLVSQVVVIIKRNLPFRTAVAFTFSRT